jgi:uncharacterized protein YciI
MKFANYIHYIDELDRVASVRPSHRAYLANLLAEGKLAAAGPFADGTGALFIYEAESLELAHQFADEDPYTRNEVIRTQVITQWDLVYSSVELLTP